MEQLIKRIKNLFTFVCSINNVEAPMSEEKLNEYTAKVKKLEEEIEKDFVDSCCEDYDKTLKQLWEW